MLIPGEHHLRRAGQAPPHDRQPPVRPLDGLKRARRITHRGVHLVLLTSDAVPRPESAREAGIVGVLTKPLHRSQLHDCLATILAPTAEPGSRSPAQAAADRALEHRSGHVLIVEDNEINQAVAIGFLARLGYTADIASHSQQPCL
jgi:CheY-like chemotaxis protein